MAALCCIITDTHSDDSSPDLSSSTHHSMPSPTSRREPKPRKRLPRSTGTTHLVQSHGTHVPEFGSDREALREFRQIFQLSFNSQTTSSPAADEGHTTSFAQRPKDFRKGLVSRLRRRLSHDSALKEESNESNFIDEDGPNITSRRRSKLMKRKGRYAKNVLTSHRPLALFAKGVRAKPEASPNEAVDIEHERIDFDTDAHLLADESLCDRVNDPSSLVSTTRSINFKRDRVGKAIGGDSSGEGKLQASRTTTTPYVTKSPCSTLVSSQAKSFQCRETDPAITYQNLISPAPTFEPSEPNFSRSDVCVRLSLEAPQLSLVETFTQKTGSEEPLIPNGRPCHRNRSRSTSRDSEIALAVEALVDCLPSFGLEHDSDISRYQSISSQFYSTCASRITKPHTQRARITELSEETTPVFRESQEAITSAEQRQDDQTGANNSKNCLGVETQSFVPVETNSYSDQKDVPGHKRVVSSSGSSLHLHKMRISQHLRSLSSLSDVSSRAAPTISSCLPPRESSMVEQEISNKPGYRSLNEDTDAVQSTMERNGPQNQTSRMASAYDCLFDSGQFDQAKISWFSSLDDTIERAAIDLTSNLEKSKPLGLSNSETLKIPTESNLLIEFQYPREAIHKMNICASRPPTFSQESPKHYVASKIDGHDTSNSDDPRVSILQKCDGLGSHQDSCYDGLVEPQRETRPPVAASSSSVGGNYNEAAAMWEKALRTHQTQLFEPKKGNQHSISDHTKMPRKESEVSSTSGYDPLDLGSFSKRRSSEGPRIGLKKINTEHSFDLLTIPERPPVSRKQSLNFSVATEYPKHASRDEGGRSRSHLRQRLENQQVPGDVVDSKVVHENIASDVSPPHLAIPEIKVTDIDSESRKSEPRFARIRPVSTLRAWSRYPSHTRGERSLSAGILDNIITRDFAVPDSPGAGMSGIDIERDSSEMERVNKRKRAKARSIMLKRKLLDLPSLFKSRSMVGFGKGERGHRSSIAPAGKLDYPELELMPPRAPRIASPSDHSGFASNTKVGPLDGVGSSGQCHILSEGERDGTEEGAGMPGQVTPKSHTRLVSSEYSSRKSDADEVRYGIGSLDAAIGPYQGEHSQTRHINAQPPINIEQEVNVLQKSGVDAHGADRRRMRRSTQDLCQRMDTEERVFLEELLED